MEFLQVLPGIPLRDWIHEFLGALVSISDCCLGCMTAPGDQFPGGDQLLLVSAI